jgi:hypothetical protein
MPVWENHWPAISIYPSVRYTAGTLGWTAELIGLSDAAITDLLGLARGEAFSRINLR